MSYFRLFFLSIFIISLVTACHAGALSGERFSPETDDLPRDFTLKAGETVLVNDIDFQFERVKSDSRCAKGTQCISAGSAQVVVNYELKNKPIQKVLTVGKSSMAQQRLKVGDTLFTLAFLKPYPVANVIINPAEYQAHFIASETGDLEQATVIDVRTTEEFESGHYQGANHIPYDDITKEIDSLNLSKDKTIIVYCRSGNRAAKAKNSLEQLGYFNVINAADQAVVESLMNK